MGTKEVLYELRTKNGLSQDELAEKVFVTRQAVSRWENGETVPNTETLKQLSNLFNVSINTLLGSPHKLVCQCCGMPLEDEIISREKDGSLNEDYCKWCYADGTYTYSSMDNL
ncbi:MAG: helix-turn-helix domain-containing protein, partial [Acutalibacteraceae bacterium]|nr:helix-turn-helix domain-containing protein [Acutalibacteraceae bacterium]